MPTAIDLCSLAWAEQSGFVFLAVRDPTKDKQDSGYWRDIKFKWPDDRVDIDAILNKAKSSEKDVYWCPNVFTEPHRSRDSIADIATLYADLDTVNPRDLPEELYPTAAWRTSPGRWQAMWSLDRAIDSNTQSQLNQRLTYAVGADKGGWDLTQVLRVPGTHNHKYPEQPTVQLLWVNGHQLNPIKLINDLPAIEAIEIDRTPIQEVPDQSFVLSRHRVGVQAKKLIRAKHPSGDRSAVLWQLECLLAEAGLTAEEIVGVVRPTVWNKFADRRDELKQLSSEARKAIDRTEAVQDTDHSDALEVVEDLALVSAPAFNADHAYIKWMVADVWGDGEVGFISGHPKSYKSWLAIDLAISVASETLFLGVFKTRQRNVLLIQEEDPKPILQERIDMVAASKGLVGWEDRGDGTFDMWYDLPEKMFVVSNQGFTINEDRLEELEAQIIKEDIKLVILDPLMMMGGNVDEFKAFEFMASVLKPLKRLRAKTGSAIVIIHHHTKAASQHAAKDMYGSVALWAWEEAALHLSAEGVGRVVAERFSKHKLLHPITIEIGEIKDKWSPRIEFGGSKNLYDVLMTMDGGATVDELMDWSGLGRDAVDRQLRQLAKDDRIMRGGDRHSGGRPKVIWRIKP
jgi:AAA domain/RepB DNA-primase N-terminal domain